MHDRDHDPNRDTQSLDALRHDRDQLQAQLEICRHDLHQARMELANAREIQESLTEQLHAGGGTTQARLDPAGNGPDTTAMGKQGSAWPVRAWRRMTLSADARALRQDIQLLHDSEWFDPDWYQAEYPDVANAGLDPAEHYLRFGAPEGRDPGPLFSTDAYLRDHPGLAGQGTNPLVHFLRSGHGTGV